MGVGRSSGGSRPGRPPGLGDVATLAGVSHQTVSRVVNNSPHVRPATRERVLSAMAQLGYQPNLAARTLVTARSGLVGVLATGLPHLGPSAILASIETAARAAGYHALVGVLDDDPEQVDAILASFAAHRVDGVAIIAPYPWLLDRARDAARSTRVLVVADAPMGDGVAQVGVDQAAGATAAVAHLIAQGCTDIAHIAGPEGWIDADRRVQGWRDALATAGLPEDRLLRGDWTPERGHALGRSLVAEGLPDAVFCGNDHTALGLMAAFRETSVRVPGDVRLVGFDDMIGAGYLDPPLTTIRQPFAELGTAAVEGLLALLAGGEPASRAIVPELVVRSS